MFGYIILRDVPKQAAQLDLSVFEIQGGFRGFAQVLPGIHYATVKVGEGMHKGFWCYVPPNGVVVRRLGDESNVFETDEPETEAHYQQLAASGAMNQALVPVAQRNTAMATLWQRLTSYLNEQNFPPAFHQETPMSPPLDLPPEELSNWFLTQNKSRFEQAFQDTHQEDVAAFLAEFQYCFVLQLLAQDEVAYARWRHLLQAIYSAGTRSIEAAADLFPPLVDIIIAQLSCFPDEVFVPGSFLIERASDLAEDMVDTDVAALQAKGRELEAYLARK